MTTRGPRAPRGQNLVLLALTMLFLVLMVTMTLGLGLRIRQKHELQNLADAAAYSNAVVEARAFNNMALINRLEVSHWVAMAADQSLISWTGYSRGMSLGAQKAVLKAYASCGDEAQRRALVNTWVGLVLYSLSEFLNSPDWNAMDAAAGREARAIQSGIAGLRDELSASISGAAAGETLAQRLERYQRDQIVTQQVLRAAGVSRDEVTPLHRPGEPPRPGSVLGINRREVDCDFGATGNGPLEGFEPPGAGLCMRGTWNLNMLHAAMGSRGNPFVTGRGPVPPKTQAELTAIGAARGTSITFSGVTGSGYWGVGRPKHGNDPVTTEAWADDHGSVTVSTRDCSGFEGLRAHVKSTHLDDADDSHGWTTEDDAGAADTRHTMGTCQPLCPSVWVRTVGFQPNDSPGDAYGQPKVVVALERNLAFRRFPWELNFSFPFSATGTAREWDGRGQQLHRGPAPGLDISKQVAWATGIVYYHRFEHWNEFPNLLNPFWRATLAPADVDLQGRSDVVDALRGPHKWQGDAYDELVKAGFKGLH
ncbi:MAG: Tad domain-containing protein [Myxococcota bacterium]